MKEDFRVNFRLGLILAGSLAVGAAGCAPAGAPVETGPQPTVSGEVLAQGERPRENEMTRAAAEELEQAAELLAEAEEAGTGTEAAEATARTHYQAALRHAEQAIAADSTNPLPWYQGGLANLGLDAYVEADRMFARAEELRPVYVLEIEPRRERAWIDLFNQAQPLLSAADYEAAARIFEQADVIYDKRPEVKIVLGQIYLQLDRPQEAAELFQGAIDIIESEQIEEVDSATAAQWTEQGETLPLAIADALIQAENYEAAARQLRVLMADDPDNVVLARNLASVFIRMEQPDSADLIYSDLLARPNLSGADYYQIGVGLYNMDEYDRAAQAFANAVAAAPRHRDAAEMRARSVQLTISNLPEGEDPSPALLDRMVQAAEGWLELDPYSRNAHLITAQAANRLGDEDRARELVQAIEALPVIVDNLQIRHTPGGGGTVLGQVINLNRPAGSNITLEVTFYGEGGTVLGTETANIQLPGEEAAQPFRVELEAEQPVTGYSYTLRGIE